MYQFRVENNYGQSESVLTMVTDLVHSDKLEGLLELLSASRTPPGNQTEPRLSFVVFRLRRTGRE